jgi:hypothetical protein
MPKDTRERNTRIHPLAQPGQTGAPGSPILPYTTTANVKRKFSTSRFATTRALSTSSEFPVSWPVHGHMKLLRGVHRGPLLVRHSSKFGTIRLTRNVEKGRLVFRYLKARAKDYNLRWAIAVRSKANLEELVDRDAFGHVALAHSRREQRRHLGRDSQVNNGNYYDGKRSDSAWSGMDCLPNWSIVDEQVGPYSLYGENLVKCVFCFYQRHLPATNELRHYLQQTMHGTRKTLFRLVTALGYLGSYAS